MMSGYRGVKDWWSRTFSRLLWSDLYSFGRLSNTRLALPSERSSVSGATARTRADIPMGS
jgi:hypothetical protein